jgi:hypothetical protein
LRHLQQYNCTESCCSGGPCPQDCVPLIPCCPSGNSTGNSTSPDCNNVPQHCQQSSCCSGGFCPPDCAPWIPCCNSAPAPTPACGGCTNISCTNMCGAMPCQFCDGLGHCDSQPKPCTVPSYNLGNQTIISPPSPTPPPPLPVPKPPVPPCPGPDYMALIACGNDQACINAAMAKFPAACLACMMAANANPVVCVDAGPPPPPGVKPCPLTEFMAIGACNGDSKCEGAITATLPLACFVCTQQPAFAIDPSVCISGLPAGSTPPPPPPPPPAVNVTQPPSLGNLFDFKGTCSDPRLNLDPKAKCDTMKVCPSPTTRHTLESSSTIVCLLPVVWLQMLGMMTMADTLNDLMPSVLCPCWYARHSPFPRRPCALAISAISTGLASAAELSCACHEVVTMMYE